MSAVPDEVGELQRRMHALRSTGDRDVRQLQNEMERVADWREHVRARPVLSAVAAAVVGFTVVRAVFATRPASAPVLRAGTNRSAAGSALAFVGGMASTLVRQWISDYVKKELKVGQNGSAAKPNSRSHERTSSFS